MNKKKKKKKTTTIPATKRSIEYGEQTEKSFPSVLRPLNPAIQFTSVDPFVHPFFLSRSIKLNNSLRKQVSGRGRLAGWLASWLAG